MKTFYDSLVEKNIKVLKDEPMKNHTTFKIGGNAKYFVLPKDENEIIFALIEAEKFDERVLVLGNGSNMLVSDNGFDGVIIHIGEEMSKTELLGDNVIKAQSGALLIRVCREALSNSLSGMEKLFGIPGSVGGGLYMNAGAYGGEMKDVVFSAEYIDEDKKLKSISADDMALSYRHSFFSDKRAIITSVTFKLKKGNKDDIKSEMDKYMQLRKDKQPLEYPSAGSVFKRPEGYFAGALIEECGLKGKKIGGAQVSEKHAGFIVNAGNATQKDVTELIALCRETVFRQKNVMLESEIKIYE